MKRAKQIWKKVLSFSMALMMTASCAGSIDVAAETNATDKCIDLTFDASGKSWGLDFGSTLDAYSRWQSFTLPEDGILDTAEVWLIKRVADGQESRDLVASVYSMQDGLPNEALGSVTVEGSDVVNKGITEIDMSSIGVLEEGQYAFVLTTEELADNLDKTNGAYDWVSSTASVTELAGQIGVRGTCDETANIGNMYLKLSYGDTSKSIDYSFDASGKSWGLDFGSTLDAYSRWQSFTLPEDGTVKTASVWLIKRVGDDQESRNLVASVYQMSDGVPTESIGSVTVEGSDVVNKGITEIDMSSLGVLKAGQYAFVLTTEELADNLDKTNGAYDWVSSTATGSELAGQIGVRGTCDETANIGNMYLKLVYTPGSYKEDTEKPGEDLKPAPEGSVPYDISITVSEEKSLAIGETVNLAATVLDQNGAYIESAEVSFTADSDVVTITADGKAASVKANKEGVATVTVQSDSAVNSVDVYVYDPDKTYTEPYAGMVITENTTLKPGIYNFNGADKGIVIGADNVKVVADYVKIVNAEEDKLSADVTTGAYAYQLNPVSGKSAYNMTREVVLSKASSVKFSFDAKAKHFVGTLKVQVSKDGSEWTDKLELSYLAGWKKYTVDMSEYADSTVYIRLRYETDTEIPEDMVLLIDTMELFEDSVRTFSDLCEAKPFYYWDISYGDGSSAVADTLKNKPFDRTEYSVSTSLFSGTGVLIDGVKSCSISGLTVKGFYWAMELSDCTGIKVDHCNLSNNYYDPNGGWGDQEGGGLLMDHADYCTVTDNDVNNNANALIMRQSNHNTISCNSFSIASDVCLEMDNSSYNTVEENDFSWGIRIDAYDEVHARDSTGSLFESGSNYNYVYKNDFTHGGDGIFLRPLDGFCSEGNVFKENDCSYANNNAVESWAGRNYYIGNKANWSSYGFWLGGSDESELYYNEMAYNGICPHNAPESFGNAGLSIVASNPSSHIIIVGNDIHDNYGPGIALTHTESWPAYHYLIQNNKITNNVTSEYNSAHVGYAIWLDQIEWVDISGNYIEGNSKDSIRTSSGTKLVTERDGEYIASQSDYEAQVPKAVISSDKTVYYVGEEITFSGTESTDPNGDTLTFRWDLGDGTYALGDTVKHTFTETGYYSVAFTVTDGTWSDLAWLNVNVVQLGEEIGTDEDASKWEYTSNNGATTLEKQLPAEGKESEEIPYYTYYTVDGESSIKMHSTAGRNTITYPASKDAGLDLSEDNALSFSMKVQNGTYEDTSHKSPIVRLYTDESNYVQYQATSTLLAPYYYKEIFAQMQLRHEWVAVTIPYDGSTMWKKSVVGTPDMSKINYISITTETYANNFTFYVDALKSVSVEETKANAYVQSIAQDGTAIYSTTTASSKADNIISGVVDSKIVWESAADDTNIWFGVDFGTERYVDRVDYYLYYEPVGNPSLDTLVMPNAVTFEYESGGEWKEITDVTAGTITSNRNIATFDAIKTSKIRVKFDTTDHAPVALYGFHVFNTENYMAERDYENNPVVKVTSSVKSDVVLDAVEVWGVLTDASLWDTDVSDLQVYIYETDASLKGPNGAYLAKGLVKKDSVDPSELPQLFKVEMGDDNGEKITLKAGAKYALLLTQTRDYSNTAQGGWKFPVSTAIDGETFGKVTGTNNVYTSISGFTVEALGTGWLKVYADGSDEPIVDYSFDYNKKSGYGVGIYTEDSRYQTFTIPEDSLTHVINGNVNDGKSWSFDDETGYVYAELDEEKTINRIHVAFEENGIPETMTIWNGDSKVAALTEKELTAGLNEITLEESITAKKLTFEFKRGEKQVQVSEIELMNLTNENSSIGVENPFVDVQEGKYYYDAVRWAVENNITKGVTDTTFCPDDNCTRAQAVMFLYKNAGSPEIDPSIPNPFSDVHEGGTFYKAIMWAYQNKITTGYKDGTFRPLDKVTRGEYIAFQYRAAGEPEVSIANPFSDVSEGYTFYDAIMWAAKHGITLGQNGRFLPADDCSRGHVVTFLYRANHLED